MSNQPPFVCAPGLDTIDGVSHGFFGRQGGVSKGLYESLNAGPGSNDLPADVDENRNRIATAIGVQSGAHLCSAYQVHSASAVFVDRPLRADERPQCDALVTDRSGLGLCALAADCAPVLLVEPETRLIASIHSGWKGAVAGVIEATIELIERKGGKAGRVVAAIGPCISQSSYEVGPEFRDTFVSSAPWSEPLFAQGREDRLQFDLKGFCDQVLKRIGVAHVDVIADDTLTNPDVYFSNRYSVRHGRSDYGRNASAIALLE